MKNYGFVRVGYVNDATLNSSISVGYHLELHVDV